MKHDKMTHGLTIRNTGEIVKTDYVRVGINEISIIQKNYQWKFNWIKQWQNRAKSSEFYVLVTEEERKFQGLVEIRIEQGCVKCELIESAPQNVGKTGELIGVGSHLIAIAIKRSFETGGEGIVFFEAKTQLIEHYIKTFKARVYFGNMMYIDKNTAGVICQKFFGSENNEQSE